MTKRSEEAGPGMVRQGVRNVVSAVSTWVDPEENPSGVVYGTLAVGAVLAAESTRRETFPDLIEATLTILALYWLAHTYATFSGDRLRDREALSMRGLWRALVHEGAIVKGAFIPIAVLAALWATGVPLGTAVTAALWTSATSIALFEVLATLRSDVTGVQRVIQISLGVLLGAGVLLVRVILH